MKPIDAALKFFPKLQRLEVSHSPEVIGGSWPDNTHDILPFLSVLVLRDCYKLRDLRHVFSISTLTALTLDSLFHLKDSDLIKCEPLQNLQHLCISECYELSIDGIIALLRNCPSLTSLELRDNVQVDGDILEHALLLCPYLHSFSGENICNVGSTSRGKGLTHLKTLKLVGCSFRGSDDILANLLSTCSGQHGLECLTIGNCEIRQISCADILSVIGFHSSLRSLTILNDKPISWSEALLLLNSLKHLSSLTACVHRDPRSLDAKGVEFLKFCRKAHPSVKLKILFDDS